LKALGIDNILHFDFLDAAPTLALTEGLELLYSLNAIDDSANLKQPFGKLLSEFPMEPQLATVLLNSTKYQCTEEALVVCAMLSVQNVFCIPSKSRNEALAAHKKFHVEEGDHITYINIFNAFLKSHQSSRWASNNYLDFKALSRAVSIHDHLSKHMRRIGITVFESCKNNLDLLIKCILSGFFANAAKIKHDGTYETVKHRQILEIHPNSVLYQRSPGWVCFNDVMETSKAYMRDLIVIEPEWLTELAPHYYIMKS
jgi:ATP-dependent RNA helicase DDX35